VVGRHGDVDGFSFTGQAVGGEHQNEQNEPQKRWAYAGMPTSDPAREHPMGFS
jgi:hypothetical protein